ncbi:cof family hydrolase subfamily protein [Cystoisospora suis]|uniref:Cof family hydrolase subfamily protein n=1 Tax=Cystoisospora suis TaxID=483139 RepID=A0A2C6KPU5_9APIC|nr:cof family hydrolase subfamily protein [Cystoisospora suis]
MFHPVNPSVCLSTPPRLSKGTFFRSLAASFLSQKSSENTTLFSSSLQSSPSSSFPVSLFSSFGYSSGVRRFALTSHLSSCCFSFLTPSFKNMSVPTASSVSSAIPSSSSSSQTEALVRKASLSCCPSSYFPPFFSPSLFSIPPTSDDDGKAPPSCVSPPCIRLVVTDLDGTLLNSSHKISQENIEACRRLKECDLLCAFATGRPLKGAVNCIGEETLKRMNVPNGYPGIYMNGCMVYGRNGEVLHEETLSSQIQSILFDFFDQHGLWDRICGYTHEGIFSTHNNRYTRHTHDTYHEPEPIVLSREDFRRTLFSKITVNGDDFHIDGCPMRREKQENIRTDVPNAEGDLSQWRDMIEALLADLPARCVQPIPGNIEVIPRDISKAKGIDILLRHLGVQKDQVLALGDSENDLEMLKDVPWSICVGNACNSAKECAKYCTLSNDENGFAHVVNIICDEQQQQKSRRNPSASPQPPHAPSPSSSRCS